MNSILTLLALAFIGAGAALAALATAQALHLEGLVYRLRATATPGRRLIASAVGVVGVGVASALLMGLGPNVFSGTLAGVAVWAGVCASFLALSYAAVGSAPATAATVVVKPQTTQAKRAA